MKCLALYLKAPLQSWGVGAKFGSRPTMSFPSRSGIVGLLAAAAGIDRTDDDWLKQVARLKIEVFAFAAAHDSDGMRMIDYHTVGGGNDDSAYKKTNIWRYRMAVAKAEGGAKTELTYREYLQDAAFGVVVSGSDAAEAELVDKLASAVQNPVWGVWLGRKSCVPTEPVFAGEFDDAETAVQALAERAEACGRGQTLVVREVSPGDGEENLLDVPVSFSRREFASRSIETE